MLFGGGRTKKIDPWEDLSLFLASLGLHVSNFVPVPVSDVTRLRLLQLPLLLLALLRYQQPVAVLLIVIWPFLLVLCMYVCMLL